jgi:hypothetical protein
LPETRRCFCCHNSIGNSAISPIELTQIGARPDDPARQPTCQIGSARRDPEFDRDQMIDDNRGRNPTTGMFICALRAPWQHCVLWLETMDGGSIDGDASQAA